MLKTGVAAAIAVAAGFLAPGIVAAQGADRLSDKDVKALIEAVDNGRDRFEDALDGGFKGSILRGPGGEVHVKKFLDDFQNEVGQLKDRFKPDYAASAEAKTVLNRAREIDGFVKGQPSPFKGASEWDRLVVELRRLAGVYGTTFPLPEGAAVRRMNDKETAAAADQLARQADLFKKTVGKDNALTSTERDAAKRQADDLAKAAKALKSRTSSGKPATGEARQVLDLVGQIGASPAAKKFSPATLSSWGVMQSNLAKLEQAFNIAAPTAR